MTLSNRWGFSFKWVGGDFLSRPQAKAPATTAELGHATSSWWVHFFWSRPQAEAQAESGALRITTAA
eukprot:2052531-Pyramimonas_sp.AAC.1